MTATSTTERHRTGWVGYAAAGWAAAYTTIALVWTVTGDGFPFGRGDPDAFGILRDLPAGFGAPLFAATLGTTAVLVLAMVGGSSPPRPLRTVMLAVGWLVAGALLVVVPEPSLLALAAYAPVLIVGAPFGWPPDAAYEEIFTWPIANQVFSLVGGALLAATVLAWQRCTRGACERCGRESAAAGRTTPAGWGRWAVYVAMAVPLVYATTRFAWVLRIPLTVTDGFVDELHESGAVWAGAWLATFATIGAILTLGLVRPWGERFPRWLPGLAGRRVPVMLAVIPAGLVSALVTSAGLGMASHPEAFGELGGGDWIHLPSLLWPVWGVALAAAAFGYYLRRRGPCRRCGRSG